MGIRRGVKPGILATAALALLPGCTSRLVVPDGVTLQPIDGPPHVRPIGLTPRQKVNHPQGRAEDQALIRLLENEVRTRAAASTVTRHYVIVFGYQDERNQARLSHTFGAFYRCSPQGELQRQDISWLPACLNDALTVQVHPVVGQPVAGRNYSIDDTLAFARANELKLGVWGPIEVHHTLYDAAEKQVARLDSGQVQYIAADNRHRHSGHAMNCERAITSLAGDRGFILTWGLKGTERALTQLATVPGWMLEPVALNQFRYKPPHAPVLIPVVQ